MNKFGSSSNLNFRGSFSNLNSPHNNYYSYSNNHINSNNSNCQQRNVPHIRIEDEETIFKKYELGKKLGQVKIF